MIEYKLKPKVTTVGSIAEVVLPDIKEITIVKSGHEVEFTMLDVEANKKQMDQLLTELKAKKEFEDAKIENIEHFHEFVKTMSKEDLHTAWMYNEAKETSTLLGAKIEEVSTQLEKDNLEIEEIKKQIPELVEVDPKEETGRDYIDERE